MQHQRSRGILLGLAAGDRNGGPIEMAVVIAESLAALGRYDGLDVGARYLRWFGEGGPAVWDTGPTAGTVFKEAQGDPSKLAACAKAYNLRRGGMTIGCNVCHRIPPLSMLMALGPDDLVRAAMEDAALSHACALAGAASAATALVCRGLIEGLSVEAAAKAAARHSVLQNADAEPVRQLLERAPQPLQELSMGGSSVEALTAGLHFAATAEDFASGLEQALGFAGPENYCPVVAGAFLGGRFGAEAIPQEMLGPSRSHKFPGANFPTLMDRIRTAAAALAPAPDS